MAQGISGSSSQSPINDRASGSASGKRLVSLPTVAISPTFLTLPGEIRICIYDILFKTARPVQLVVCTNGNDCGPVRDYCGIIHGASLLGTCHQVYVEAAGILYAQGTFNVRNLHGTYYSNCLVEEVGSWLSKVSRHSSVVGPILLDINRKQCSRAGLKVFPVFRYLCIPQNAGLRVTFTGTCVVGLTSPSRPLVDVAMLNKAIVLLKVDAPFP
jgi:hypothetical protein